jgi:O-antigen/teichoic acid export membrane protein
VSGGEKGQVLRTSALYLIPPLLGRALSFATLPLYAEALGPEEYGRVAFAVTLMAGIALPLTLGVHTSLARLHHQLDEADQGRLVSSVLAFLAVFPLALTGLVDVGATAWGLEPFESVPYDPYVRLALWGGALSVLSNVPVTLYTTRERARPATILQTLFSAIPPLAPLIPVLVLGGGGEAYLAAMVGANGVLFVGALVASWPLVKGLPSRALLGQALGYGAPLLPALLANYALSAGDRAVLEAWVSPAELGRYSLGCSVAALAALTNVAVQRAFVPVANRRMAAGAADELGALGTPPAVLLAWGATGLSVLSGPLIRGFFDERFAGAEAVVPWVAFGLAFQGLVSILSVPSYYAARTGWIAAVAVTAASVNVGANLLMVPHWGIRAAAVTTLGAYALGALLQALLSQQTRPVPWPWARWGWLLGASVGVTVVGQGLTGGIPGVGLVVGLIWGTFALPAVLWFSGWLEASEKAAISAQLQGFRRRLG